MILALVTITIALRAHGADIQEIN